MVNWPDLTHVFGYTEIQDNIESYDFLNLDDEKVEVKELEFCIKWHLKGLRFTLYDGSLITLNADDCTDWQIAVALDRRRLIGFKVLTAEAGNEALTRAIKEIQPIVDYAPCDNSAVSLRTLDDMTLNIGEGSIK